MASEGSATADSSVTGSRPCSPLLDSVHLLPLSPLSNVTQRTLAGHQLGTWPAIPSPSAWNTLHIPWCPPCFVQITPERSPPHYHPSPPNPNENPTSGWFGCYCPLETCASLGQPLSPPCCSFLCEFVTTDRLHTVLVYPFTLCVFTKM